MNSLFEVRLIDCWKDHPTAEDMQQMFDDVTSSEDYTDLKARWKNDPLLSKKFNGYLSGDLAKEYKEEDEDEEEDDAAAESESVADSDSDASDGGGI